MSVRWAEDQFLKSYPRKPVEWPITGLNDEGGIDCYKTTEVVGVLIGDATVHENSQLILRGMVTGNVVIEKGAVAYVHGVVAGDVTVQGAIAMYGVICGAFREEDDSVAFVSEHSVIAS
jgi:hypothetical protein